MKTGRGDGDPAGGSSYAGLQTVAVRRPLPANLACIAVLAIALGTLASCGGGGSSSNNSGHNGSPVVTLSVSPTSISESATVGQSAPVATLMVYANGITTGQQIHLAVTNTSNGIASISAGTGTPPVTVSIYFKSPAALATGAYQDTINLTECYDQGCTQQVSDSPQAVPVTYTVSGSTVKLTALNPSAAIAGGPAFTLTATGTSFTAQAQLSWNGTLLPTTLGGSSSLSAEIPASDIASAGSASVAVSDPANGTSSPLSFNITPAQLSLSSVSPASVSVGGSAFMLTALGSGFTSASVVQWNGSARATTYVSQSEVVAQISAADIAAVGIASITVKDPTTSLGTTNPQTATIAPASVDATGFQMNAAHSANVTFASLLPLPSAPAWSVDVGGTPSYALIAAGKVFITVPVVSGSEVMALDQATGDTVWGPIPVPGGADAVYDNGRVFVLSSPIGDAATMEALDADTGAIDWSTLLSGEFMFTSALSAGDGLVFTGAGGNGDSGTLYALDEVTGVVVWTGEVKGGDNSTPAVTPDGVYVTYPCRTYDFRPATGDSIWSTDTGCEGGGGNTPVVANQLVYSPENYPGYNGNIYGAENGSSQGTFTGSAPPALSAGMGYFLQSGSLVGIAEPANAVKWSFAGDGTLTGAPIVVNQYVFIGSTSGNLYALAATTGNLVWTQALGAGIDSGAAGIPYSGLAAGDGLLIVPAGTKVIAYTLSTNP